MSRARIREARTRSTSRNPEGRNGVHIKAQEDREQAAGRGRPWLRWLVHRSSQDRVAEYHTRTAGEKSALAPSRGKSYQCPLIARQCACVQPCYSCFGRVLCAVVQRIPSVHSPTNVQRLGGASDGPPNDVRKVAARLEAVSQVDTGSCREIVQTPSTAINIAIRRRVASCTANLFMYPASAFSRCQLFLGVAGRWQGRGVEWTETKAALGSRYLPLRHREVAPCTVARGAHAVVESCTVALSSRGAVQAVYWLAP